MKKQPYWKVCIQKTEKWLNRIEYSDSAMNKAMGYIEILEESEITWEERPRVVQAIAGLARIIPVSRYTRELIERLNSIQSNLLRD